MSHPIGDPRPAGKTGPAGDQRKDGEEGVAGDPRPAGAEKLTEAKAKKADAASKS
jgi:hypothetical protein